MSETAVAYQAGPPRTPTARHLRTVAEPFPGYHAAPPAEAPGDQWTPGDGAEVDAGAALAALARAADLMARADLGALDARALLEHTVAMDRQVTRLHAAQARALGDIDRRQAYTQDACVTTASWLRWRTRRDFAHATRMAVTARRLAALPATWAAVQAGDITMSHAEAIAAAAIPARRDAIAAHEATLVALAGHALPRDVRRACAHIADQVDPDGADPNPGPDNGGADPDAAPHNNGADPGAGPDGPDPGRDGADPGRDGADPAPPGPDNGGPDPGRGGRPDPARQLYLSRLGDGWDLRARLDALTGERLNSLLFALDSPDPPDTPAEQRRTPAQRRHDAFDRILRAAQDHPDLPTAHGARPHILVLIDLYTLLGRADLATRPPRLGSGAPLDLPRALQLLDDASLTPVLMAGPWRPVGVGRRHRTLPAWLRPLLTLIHRHCRGPGCDRPITWTHAAHLTPWASGADTHLDHTIPACPGHHRLMDTAGWNVTLDPDTAICTWTSPDGHTTWRTHPPDP